MVPRPPASGKNSRGKPRISATQFPETLAWPRLAKPRLGPPHAVQFQNKDLRGLEGNFDRPVAGHDQGRRGDRSLPVFLSRICFCFFFCLLDLFLFFVLFVLIFCWTRSERRWPASFRTRRMVQRAPSKSSRPNEDWPSPWRPALFSLSGQSRRLRRSFVMPHAGHPLQPEEPDAFNRISQNFFLSRSRSATWPKPRLPRAAGWRPSSAER